MSDHTAAVDDARNRRCDLSIGDVQCPYVKPHGDDGYLNCRYVEGHTVPHNDCYDGPPNPRDYWYLREPDTIADLEAQLRTAQETQQNAQRLMEDALAGEAIAQAQVSQLQATLDQWRVLLKRALDTLDPHERDLDGKALLHEIPIALAQLRQERDTYRVNLQAQKADNARLIAEITALRGAK